ncbi:MAG TPA: hypothetical protein VGL33_33300 [Streptosporangiaceae bacterium]
MAIPLTGALSITAPLFRADVSKYAGLVTMAGHRITKTVSAMRSASPDR